jgi:dihydroorotase
LKTLDLIIRQVSIVTGSKTWVGDVAVSGEKIVQMAPKILDHASQEISGAGLHLIPGVIDTQVHFREPGLTHKEDLESASMAAACGGVTSFLEMPNTKPQTTDVAALKDKLWRAENKSLVDFSFFAGATNDNLSQLKVMEKMPGCPGTKIFVGSSTGNMLVDDENILRSYFRTLKRPIAIHSEDEALLQKNKIIREFSTTALDHERWRSREVALSSTKKIIRLAQDTGKKIHILHITSKEEIEYLAKHKNICTVEVLPQHLTLIAPECYFELGTKAQMNPPIRYLQDNQALWEGIRNGTIDVIGSDHAPHTILEKQKGPVHAPSGLPGVQTMLPLMLEHVHQKKLTLNHVVKLLCENPATLYGIYNKGFLQEDFDADFNLIDLNTTTTIQNKDMKSKCGWTPYDGKTIHGKILATFLRGKKIVDNGELRHNRGGRALNFKESI